MALADIVAKIEADAAAEAARIIEAAEQRAELLRANARAQAAEHTESVVALARRDAERQAGTTVVGAKLQARDRGLAERGKLVDEAIAQLRLALVALPDDRYGAFLAARIAEAARGGETLLLGSADIGRMDSIAAAVDIAAPGLDLVIAETPAPFERGALLEGSRVRADLSLEAIVDDQRDRLEAVASEALFGEATPSR